jgi:hypothetical protein
LTAIGLIGFGFPSRYRSCRSRGDDVSHAKVPKRLTRGSCGSHPGGHSCGFQHMRHRDDQRRDPRIRMRDDQVDEPGEPVWLPWRRTPCMTRLTSSACSSRVVTRTLVNSVPSSLMSANMPSTSSWKWRNALERRVFSYDPGVRSIRPGWRRSLGKQRLEGGERSCALHASRVPPERSALRGCTQSEASRFRIREPLRCFLRCNDGVHFELDEVAPMSQSIHRAERGRPFPSAGST